MPQPKSLREISCADDYDPDSMPVDRARSLIRNFLVPVQATERVHIRQALGRILATDVMSPIDVPGHDNSAMDGWAVRFEDLARDGETRLARIGESFAGKPFQGSVGRGQAVRIFTGGVMPPGSDTVVMQERAQERDATRGDFRGRGHEAGTEPPLRRRGPQARRRRVPCGSASATGGSRHAGVARHRTRSRSTAGFASRSSRPATSWCRSAPRSPRARSTTATAIRSTAC